MTSYNLKGFGGKHTTLYTWAHQGEDSAEGKRAKPAYRHQEQYGSHSQSQDHNRALGQNQ